MLFSKNNQWIPLKRYFARQEAHLSQTSDLLHKQNLVVV